MTTESLTAELSADESRSFQMAVAEFAARWQAQPDKPDETPESTIAALWHSAAGTALSARRATTACLPSLDAAARERLHDRIARRARGEPLAYIVGRQNFMELELLASERALIPRAETEILGRAALALLRRVADERGSATAIDVCCGSGNLAIAIAWHERRARVWGSDLSDDAVAFARENMLHAAEGRDELRSRVEFRVGDLLSPFAAPNAPEMVDVIICNPPYISSGRIDALPGEIAHEPRMAFDGGPFGIRILQGLIEDAPRVLRTGGCLAFEVGLGQGRGMRKRLEHFGYQDIRELLDADGNTRVLLGTTVARS
jgi:release factor glutamine methyltransferase